MQWFEDTSCTHSSPYPLETESACQKTVQIIPRKFSSYKMKHNLVLYIINNKALQLFLTFSDWDSHSTICHLKPQRLASFSSVFIRTKSISAYLKDKTEAEIRKLSKLEGNKICVDCGDKVGWNYINPTKNQFLLHLIISIV